MQGFLRTPWNATSRTTAQDALWQHILDSNTGIANHSWPLALAKSWTGSPETGAEGRSTHAQWAEPAVYLPAQRNRQRARPTPQTEAPPPHPGKATPCPLLHLPAIWNHLHIEDSCGFQWRDVDAVTMEFPQNLHNASPEYFRHPEGTFSATKILKIHLRSRLTNENMQALSMAYVHNPS